MRRYHDSIMSWRDFSYLRHGTVRQRAACDCLHALGVMATLKEFHPTLVSTICIDIDVATSDLDIICQWDSPQIFTQKLQTVYGRQSRFKLFPFNLMNSAVIAEFVFGGFTIEIFGQPLPVEQQNAYRHLTIMSRLLLCGGEHLRETVRELKRRGWKSEAAFSSCLGLTGDPYGALFELELLSQDEMADFVESRSWRFRRSRT